MCSETLYNTGFLKIFQSSLEREVQRRQGRDVVAGGFIKKVGSDSECFRTNSSSPREQG